MTDSIVDPPSKGRLSPLFSWRGSICDSDLTPTQRHVALTLSLHMNERGGSCFPSIETLQHETGLSYDGTRRALRVLSDRGWLIRQMTHRGGDRGTRVEYVATVPGPGIVSPGVPGPGTEDRIDPGSSVVLTRDSESLSEDVIEDVSEDDSSLAPSSLDVDFEEFWLMYGRVGPKKVAKQCYAKARKKASRDEIMTGLEHWISYWQSPGAANVKWPQGWLNEERWKDEPPMLLAVVQNRPAVSPGMAALARRRMQRGES
jgi:hypothetical protein